MPTQYIKRRASNFPTIGKPHAAPIYVDSDDNILKIVPAGSGTTDVQVVDASSVQTLTNKTLTAPVLGGSVTGTYTLAGTPTVSSPSITAPTISGAGTISLTGASTILTSQTITAASISAAQYNLQSTITINPATAFTAGSNLLASVRGDQTLSAGDTLTGGFFYGVSGKFIATTGTFGDGATALRVCGVNGKVDLGTATVTTGASQVSAVWADLAGSPTGVVEVNVLRVTSSMGVNCNALGYFSGKADYLFELANDSTFRVVSAGGTIGTNPMKIKILTGAGAKYLICADDWS